MPKYLAIAQALIADIHAGRLAPGARLPAQRDLAKAFQVDLTTITRAFNEVRRQGLVEGHTKRGSFVRAPVKERYAASADPAGIVDLSMNMPPQPAGALLRERIRDGLDALLASPFGLLQLQYHSSMGVAADRLAGAQFLQGRVGTLELDRLLVTSGAQAALSGILSAALPRVGPIACAAVTYPGLLALAQRQGRTLIGLAYDAQGIVPAAFEESCAAHRPEALYLIPHIDNPTTATLPAARRDDIVRIARRFDVTLIEDDAYGALPLDPVTPFAALAPDITWHIATLAKCATPALRVAYVVAPQVEGALQLAGDIRATHLMAPPLMTGLATRWIQDGTLTALTEAVRAESASRQQLAARVLSGFDFWAHPQGHHLWLHLSPDWQTKDFGQAARQAGLSVVTSGAFAVGAPPNALRISLGASASQPALEQGLKLLAHVLAGAMQLPPAIV
ncbi:PLP-dependent aminotransferase family protein [Methylovirgula sp. 4M-Z18]|nr:PLP-dependent aminotransferase family protein [Methylovirgula sp. 4M-Z18]